MPWAFARKSQRSGLCFRAMRQIASAEFAHTPTNSPAIGVPLWRERRRERCALFQVAVAGASAARRGLPLTRIVPADALVLPAPARRRVHVAALDHRKWLRATAQLGLGHRTAIHIDAERDEPVAIVVPRAEDHAGPQARSLEGDLGDPRRDGLAEFRPEAPALGGPAR